MSPPPGFDDDGAVAEVVARLHERADKRRRTGIISDLADAERRGDLEKAARLMTDYQQLMKKA